MARTSRISTGTKRPGARAGLHGSEAGVPRRGGGGAEPGRVAEPGGMPEPGGVLSDVTDAGLALAGQPGIAWAERAMPVLGMLRTAFAEQQPFAGLRVAACMHVTAETAALVRVLTAGGAQVHLAASNPLSTQDDIAAALAAEPGVTVQARSGVDRVTYYEHIHRALDCAPDLVIDDGCDLVNTLHDARPELIATVRGGCEATSTGAARLRRMAAAGSLGFAMMAADVSAIRRMIDHKYGTSQSVLDGILRATNVLIAGKTVVVAGFGPCGSGIAERARGLGAQVIVTEVDPVRALAAIMQGFRVLPMVAAAAAGDVFITATGSRDVIAADHLQAMKDGTILANAGHFDVEIDVRALSDIAVEVNPSVRPHADEYVLDSGRRLILLAEGRVVNLVAGEGNPAAVMDLSFAAQALALARIAAEPRLPAAVYDMPAAIDTEIASLTLTSLDARIDEPTAVQRAYLNSWSEGS
jgi:adenosylhomocysteinase